MRTAQQHLNVARVLVPIEVTVIYANLAMTHSGRTLSSCKLLLKMLRSLRDCVLPISCNVIRDDESWHTPPAVRMRVH